MTELEALSAAAYSALYGERARPLGDGVVAFRVDEAPRSPMLNRVVGLGVEQPATEADVDAALEALAGTVHCTAYGLPVEVEPVIAGIIETPWQAWLALAGDEPTAAGALFPDGEGAYLGFACAGHYGTWPPFS